MRKYLNSILRGLVKDGKTILMNSANFFGWSESLTLNKDPSHLDHLNDDRCVRCGGPTVFDQENTTKRGLTETAVYICACCGEPHIRIVEFD